MCYCSIALLGVSTVESSDVIFDWMLREPLCTLVLPSEIVTLGPVAVPFSLAAATLTLPSV